MSTVSSPDVPPYKCLLSYAWLASRPQLVHTDSKQSVSASDDYYSLTSEGSSSEERTTVLRYDTPPMRMHHENRDAAQSEATIPTLRPVKQKDVNSSYKSKPPGDAFGSPTIKRKPVSPSSSEGTVVRRPISEISPPTPGVDDTPYIQFAIDQLTRDEEVVGSRCQSNCSEPPYPVGRVILNERNDTDRPELPPISPSGDNRHSCESNLSVMY